MMRREFITLLGGARRGELPVLTWAKAAYEG
jgi:hypothetical protein